MLSTTMMQMGRLRLSLAASTCARHLPTGWHTPHPLPTPSESVRSASTTRPADSATHTGKAGKDGGGKGEAPVSPVSLTETHEWRPEATHYAALADIPPIRKLNPIRRDRRCPRREVSFGVDEWALHKSVWRHWRHIFSEASSSTLQRLSFPALAVIAASASGVTAYNTLVADAAAGVAELALPALPFTISSLVLGLLVCYTHSHTHTCTCTDAHTHTLTLPLTRTVTHSPIPKSLA